ncbi:MAG: hypothetical protein AB8B85_00195 [Paracoccaceae bacterium]
MILSMVRACANFKVYAHLPSHAIQLGVRLMWGWRTQSSALGEQRRRNRSFVCFSCDNEHAQQNIELLKLANHELADLESIRDQVVEFVLSRSEFTR